MKKTLLFFLAACNVSTNDPGRTGAAAEGTACGHALVVANSDYASTSISIVSLDGKVLSDSLISSGSASAGVSAALSGDVVLPSTVPPSGRVVLIDRYPNSVLTFVDARGAAVLGQLSVSTGFPSNPHDYLEVSETKAYVTRYETNPSPGKQKHDEGGDVLVVDTRAFTVTGRVALPAGGEILPRADRMVRVGDQAWVVLQRFDAEFKKAGEGQVVGIDTRSDAIAWTIDLPDLVGCGPIAASPSKKLVAVACSGLFADEDKQAARSGVVVIDTATRKEVRRLPVAQTIGAPVGPGLDFVSEDRIVGVSYGDAKAARSDVAYVARVDGSSIEKMFDAGSAMVLGEVRCTAGCGDLCFFTDARASTLRVFDANLAPRFEVKVDGKLGLPPRAIGGY
jgi:hypothetical protein